MASNGIGIATAIGFGRQRKALPKETVALLWDDGSRILWDDGSVLSVTQKITIK